MNSKTIQMIGYFSQSPIVIDVSTIMNKSITIRQILQIHHWNKYFKIVVKKKKLIQTKIKKSYSK
jgi:hypothetical protein